jgi:hypothetical protein
MLSRSLSLLKDNKRCPTGDLLGEDLLCPLMGFKIQRGLGLEGVDDLEGFPIDVQADENADLADGGKGFMEFVKAAGAEVSHEDIEILHVPEGSLEPVNQCGTWFIGEKCQVILHGWVLYRCIV